MKEAGRPAQRGSAFAPPGRATPDDLGEQADLCRQDPVVLALLEAADGLAAVLNAQRQILAMNSALADLLASDGAGECRGLRLGEGLGCVRAGEGPDGCGSSVACQWCGALASVLATQACGEKAGGECLLSLRREGHHEAREFAVRTLPLQVAGHGLTLLLLRDISAQKRLERLNRTFIHNLSQALDGLKAGSEIMRQAGADPAAVAEQILRLADALKAEVDFNRDLQQAERGELLPQIRPVSPAVVLDELAVRLGPEAAGRLIRLPLPEGTALLATDPALLSQVLLSMVRNAQEALPSGGQARIWYEVRKGRPAFVVQNPGCMPDEVADRVFQRSFSTKAAHGRGLGTYSMKVFGEGVLGGKVGFTTGWEEGTRFFIELPSGV
ncbi:MAG TPA: HAMP domain-containing sensor histidine kinase [Geothrix sp.]|nr:HAMP domain-containing sensor histidine kinase [Geothrix sp.]